jgi:hypothetical protein
VLVIDLISWMIAELVDIRKHEFLWTEWDGGTMAYLRTLFPEPALKEEAHY